MRRWIVPIVLVLAALAPSIALGADQACAMRGPRLHRCCAARRPSPLDQPAIRKVSCCGVTSAAAPDRAPSIGDVRTPDARGAVAAAAAAVAVTPAVAPPTVPAPRPAPRSISPPPLPAALLRSCVLLL